MFSIAAINETESDRQWEQPLAPTKEAQEFFLSQKYHDGLLKMQEKDFAKARELLEEVLRDPLISDIQAENGGSDHHLRQLRFLSLKNLASVFLQLGPDYNENAMQCYLQAVELDWGDVVVWNQLGTLSCSMGSLGMARWAFEQGLRCSPTNWICMEKLMEVLIAIGDEVQCLAVSKRLLEKWPSHSRAMYVKSSIEGFELGPHGFDKLEPKHPRLKLKRKLDPPNSPSKRIRQDTEVQLMEATWSALLDRTVSILTSADVLPYCTVKVCIDGGIVKESDGMDKNTIDRTPCAKENEASATDKEQQSHERRSTRLERLRSRKSGKDEFESGRDTNLIAQNLEQFILKQASDKEVNFLSPSFQVPDVSKYTPEIEANDVKQFIELISENCNAVQLGNLLLEEFADLALPYRSYFIKLPELDRLTRQWGKERSQCCHMYLAEVFFDLASLPDNKLRREELLSDSNYHICKIIEHVTSNLPESVISEGLLNGMGTTSITPLKKDDSKTSNTVGNEIPSTSLDNGATDNITDNSADQASSDEISSFWARFYWITGCLSLASGDKGRAYDEFNRAISFLKEPVLLLHCANGKLLTIDRINCELNSLKLDFLLKDENEPIKKVPNTECIKLLPPLLFSTKDVKSESQEAVQLEVSALDLLISACEKEEKMKLDVYLECHKRKLQLLIATAGVDKLTSDSENVESSKSRLFERIVGVVRDLAKSLSMVKSFLGKGDCDVTFASLAHIIADIQALLLTVVQGCMKSILSRRSHVNKLEQIESRCLVDAAISFCKLQQLDPSVTIKSQVDLIVMVHELLAEYGLCCAGKDSKGEEGTFLKFAINHLLALKALHCTNSVEEDALHDEQSKDDDLENDEMEELESCIDGALDQSFFCLYGLNMNPDSTSEEDLVTHQNTSRGDYQTKEQCADVFHYILPYARTLSRSGLVKLRRVLRAIRKHFHQPPNEVLANNAIDVFLDGSDSCEKKLFEIYESNGDKDAIMNIIFQDEGNLKEFEKLLISSSEPNLEVYRNLYYLIVQAEDTNATDKYAGFVLKKEGEEFVEQNANLLKYDLLYNPLRFKSWQKLANIYDEEVDLLLNDGSKHMSISDWKKNITLHERVHTGRRRSRRCLLMSLVLASTADVSETHELLALVYYDSLQNVVPFYDQRSVTPTKDAIWTELCRSSMKHFEKAIALEPEWLHAFYLGKLCEKLGYSPAKAFSYYAKAGELNPTAVDPVYRLHASRLKLLYTRGKQADVIQIVAAYAYKDSTKETILSMLGWKADYLIPSNLETSMIDSPKEKDNIDPNLLDKVWLILYDDCISALGICVEGELKHFHKARYKIAQGLHRRGDVGDLERAKEELSFCFKSSRSSFTVNMWEIDGTAKKGRKKNLSVGGSKKNLEVSLSESSRKFISCIRKYMLLYLNLLEKTHDLSTLERAYNYLRTDKRFYLCIMDMIPVALGKYIQVLVSSIQNASDAATVELLLEKMFSAFMDHASMWGEVGSLPEVNCPELSETNLFGYIHQFIQLLESDLRLHQLESINEKIRKRFKNPKLSNSNLSRVCKHASLAWCRCLLVKLASITPVPDSADSSLTGDSLPLSGNDLVLYVDLQPDELLMSSPEGQEKSKGLDMNLFETLSRVKNVQIRQATEEKMEEAVGLLRSSYNFYRESSSGTFPAGVNLYTVLVPQPVLTTDGMQLQVQPVQDVIGNLDLSIPRKLLLWAYTLVHGRYSNISTVVKYCEEMKIRTKKGLPAITGISPSAGSQDSPSNIITSTAVGAGGSKEKGDKAETVEAESVVKHRDEMEIMTTGLPATSEPAVSQPSVSKVDFETAGTCSTKEKGETDEMQEHKHAKQHEGVQEDCGGNKDSNSN